MPQTSLFRALGLLLCGALVGSVFTTRGSQPVAAAAQSNAPAADLAALQADLKALRSIAPTQSHVMADVAIQFGSLWFAANKRNWPLATYYFNETRGRLNWVVRINPTVKAQVTGDMIDIKGILDGIETGSLAPLKQAIDAKNMTQFAAAYRVMLESCYACHKAVGRPYLRPMIPAVPPQPIINPDPGATWPQ